MTIESRLWFKVNYKIWFRFNDLKKDTETYMDSITLLRKCRIKDEKAWEYAYNYIIFYLQKKSVSSINIEDIAQDTILYWLNRGIDKTQINNAGAFKKLLKLKANGKTIEYFRKLIRKKEDPIIIPKKNGTEEFINPDIKPYQSNVLKELYYQQLILIIETSLLQMDKECMRILTRYFKGKYMGDLSKDMAEELGEKPNTFSTKVKRCNEKLLAFPEYQELINENKFE